MALSIISEKKSLQVVYISTFQYQTRISSNLLLILPTPILFFFLLAMEGMAIPPGTHSPLWGKGRTRIRKARSYWPNPDCSGPIASEVMVWLPGLVVNRVCGSEFCFNIWSGHCLFGYQFPSSKLISTLNSHHLSLITVYLAPTSSHLLFIYSSYSFVLLKAL